MSVVLATVLVVAGLLAPEALTPTAWRGLSLLDPIAGLFLVVAGAGAGWRHDVGVTWTPSRRWRRAGVLLVAAAAVTVARAQAEPARLVADELLRLAAATASADLARRLPWWVLTPLTAGLVLLPAALVAGDPLGRGLGAVDPTLAWTVESTLGLPVGGVPLLSLPAAVALVLVGHGLGTWAHRRPPGPATGAAFATVGVWCLVATVASAQLATPVPLLLTLPVALACTGVAALVLAVGHLTTAWGEGAPGLTAVGRTALPVVALGAVAVALVPADALPALPVLAALTAGGAVAAGVVALARRLDRPGWTLRA